MSKRYRAVKCYACWECGKLYSPTIYAVRWEDAKKAAIQAAQKCCEPKSCKRCGGELDFPSYTACRPCREILKIQRAKIVDYKDCEAPVWSDDVSGSWGEGYSGEIAEMLEACEDEGVEPPCYVHPCELDKFQFDPADILDRVHDNHHEDAVDQLEDVGGMFSFFKEWNAKQNLVSYHPDYKRIIVLNQARFDAIAEQEAET